MSDEILSREELERERSGGLMESTRSDLYATIEALAEALSVAIPYPAHPNYKTLRDKGWISE